MNVIRVNLLILFIVSIFSSCQSDYKKVEEIKAEIGSTENTSNSTVFKHIKTGSFLEWQASHLGGVGKRSGKIYCKDVMIQIINGKLTMADITINMDELTVDNLPSDDAKELVEHLKSNDFFDVKEYPTSKFELTNINPIKGTYNSKITGDLRILDISNSISFNANIIISENEVSIQSEKFVIDRSDWGLEYHNKESEGIPLDYLISDDIGFTVDITVLK